MSDLAIAVEYVPTSSLSPYARSLRVHPAAQIRRLVRLIQEVGFLIPVLTDQDGTIISGHARVIAATKLQMPKVPAIRVEHLSPAQVKALRIADSKITDGADWNTEALRLEIQELLAIDFDLDLLGFETGELDVILCDIDKDDDGPIPALPSSTNTVSQVGDLFELGDGHRIACGDSRDPELIAQLMQGQKARMALSDPPYNVAIEGHVGGLGKNHHPEFAMGSGEMSKPEFYSFLKQAVAVASDVCVEGAVLEFFMDWRSVWDLHAACMAQGLTLINLAVWDKGAAGMGSFLRSQHELVLIVKKGQSPHTNNVQLGKHGRHRSNLWSFRGANSFGAGRDEALSQHPTIKPTAMLREAILDCTKLGDIIFDGFLGSGSTVLAAEQARRRCYGIEIAPRYVDVALQRWITATGRQPIHVATGLTLHELRQQRSAALLAASTAANALNPAIAA